MAALDAKAEARIRGLDALRAFLAFWVALNHVLHPELPASWAAAGGVWYVLKAAYGLCINGQAAVIGFFVISGFCIHYPTRGTGPTDVVAFYLRRLIRVGVPLAVVLAIIPLLPMPWANLERGILWSVYAELIYYTLYPLIYRLRVRLGWQWLIALSFGAALALAPRSPLGPFPTGNYHDIGDQWAWILGLPCWLLGCRLAEEFDRTSLPVSVGQIWTWRLTVWLASVLFYYLRFHTALKHYYTLNFFAILVYFWIEREIRYYMTHRPPALLEWMGTWSYSLYLTHFIGAVLVVSLWPAASESRFGLPLRWVAVFATAYLFSGAVERPAHQVARLLARWVRGRRSRHAVEVGNPAVAWRGGEPVAEQV